MARRLPIATALVCLLITTAVQAAPAWVVGAKGGVNIADLSGDGVDDAKSHTGFDGGVFIAADFTPRLGLRLEALYVAKGAKGTVVTPGDDHPHESTWTLDYLEVPLVVVGRMQLGSAWTAGAFGGPTFAYNLKSEIETTHDVEDLDGVTEDVEIGGTVGGEITYALSTLQLLADVRYSAGFMSVVQDIAGQSIDVKTRGIGIRVGLQLPLGSR